jgi:outer membrane cobalamin receptor
MRSDQASASAQSIHPHTAVTVSLRKGIKVHGAIALATRFPTLHHLYSNTSGNPDLNPEEAAKYEFGVCLEPATNLSVTQNVFWNDIDGLIDRSSKVDTFQNVNEVRLRGAETMAEWKHSDLTVSAALGYIEALSYTPDGATREVLESRRPWIPELKFDYTLSVLLPGRLKVDHVGHLVADRVNNSGGAMPDYYTVQIRASRPVQGKLTAFVDVHNAFDVNYETETGYPEPGRMILFGIELRDRRRN